METLTKAPALTPLQEKKRQTMQQIVDSIEALQGEGLGIERLDAVKKLYDEAKGQDYVREQALAKLVGYYEFELGAAEERRRRVGEISAIYPEAVARLDILPANDKSFNNSEERYKVAP